ncbi:MAG TPA: LysE family transporter, partial [Candidatus Dormibacteraeota bacterium]|nr:LysE family transporter [Candidatus Dormibacteraeota bacterium]
VYLGLRSFFGRRTEQVVAGPTQTPGWAFAQGYLSNLGNAKMVAFFISLLPPFAGPHPSFGLLLALGFNFCLLTLAWLVAYAFAVERMRRWIRRAAVKQTLDRMLGAVLVALGVRVGVEALASS